MPKAPASPQRPMMIWHIWRPHLTMVISLATRVSGVGLYVATLLAAAWAISLGNGPKSYAQFKSLLGSPPGNLLMFALTFSFFFHLGGGIRHLVFDAGFGFEPKTATRSAAAVLVFALVATTSTWLIACVTGAA
jgi:succinate dehydrogenase / fumarate reductase cytochrome b subunit